eukprot:1128754-Rhodomonas_salina.2
MRHVNARHQIRHASARWFRVEAEGLRLAVWGFRFRVQGVGEVIGSKQVSTVRDVGARVVGI